MRRNLYENIKRNSKDKPLISLHLLRVTRRQHNYKTRKKLFFSEGIFVMVLYDFSGFTLMGLLASFLFLINKEEQDTDKRKLQDAQSGI